MNKFGVFLVSLCLIGLLAISSCSKRGGKINQANLAIQKPFGLNWEVTNKYAADPDRDCDQLIQSLGTLLNSSQKEKANLECRAEEYSTVYLPNKGLLSVFRKGEFSVGLLGGTRPTQYTYHFLHDWEPDKHSKKSKLRIAHASDIKADLIKLYGQPNTNGHFDQFIQFGFIVDNENYQPCSFWLRDDIGILLCSERVVMIDGTEMSLSFINLKEEVVGKQVRNMALIAAGKVSEPRGQDLITETNSVYSKPALKKLAKLVYSDDNNSCSKSDLEHIEDIWVKSRTISSKFDHIYERYSGDELAEYLFENSHELEELLPDAEPDLTMILLFKQAAQQGSAKAMNEIGASLLHCYNGIEQDLRAAEEWLNNAAGAGDAMAMQSLASMHLANFIDSESPKNETLKLLKQCSEISPEICDESFVTLTAFMGSDDE